MIIGENKWRKWLGLPYISVQPEWVEELAIRLEGRNISAGWTGNFEEYRWTEEVMDWLHTSGGVWYLEKCGRIDTFAECRQAKIWFRHMKNVTLFKLTFGGKTRPKSSGPQIMKQMVQAKTGALNAKWTLSAPVLIKTK